MAGKLEKVVVLHSALECGGEMFQMAARPMTQATQLGELRSKEDVKLENV